mgnify:FL=1
MIDCLLITIIFVIITDQLHFWENFSSSLKSLITRGKFKSPIRCKILECSCCQSWWVNLIYIIIIGKFTIPMIGYILLLSWTTPIISSVLTLLKNLFIKLTNTLANKFDL